MKKLAISLLLAAVMASMIVSSANAWFTPGYWKNHYEVWQTETVNWHGIVANNAAAYDWLWTAPKGDASIILAHQVIAAILNIDVMGHSDHNNLVHNAATFLAGIGIGSNPTGSNRAMCIYYAELLDAMNNDLPFTYP